MKKLVSVLAVVLFMSSSFSSINSYNSYYESIHNYDHCIFVAQSRTFWAQNYGFSAADAYEMGNNAFDNCVDEVNLAAAAGI